jgi:hypothetical protein
MFTKNDIVFTHKFYEHAAIQYMRNNSLKNEHNEVTFVKIFHSVDFIIDHSNDSAYVFITKGFGEIVKKSVFPISHDYEFALIKIHKLWNAILDHLMTYKYTFIGISTKKYCCNIRTALFEFRFEYVKKVIKPYTCN